jgi:hypothetical protein
MGPDIGGFKYKRSHTQLTLPCKMEAKYPQKTKAETESDGSISLPDGTTYIFLYILYIYTLSLPQWAVHRNHSISSEEQSRNTCELNSKLEITK